MQAFLGVKRMARTQVRGWQRGRGRGVSDAARGYQSGGEPRMCSSALCSVTISPAPPPHPSNPLLPPPPPRTHSKVVKEIWAYIKANDLQEPTNRRNINLDAKMATIFTPPINMFSMNKQISRHVKAAHEVANDSGDDGDGDGNGGGRSSSKRAPAARKRAPASASKKRAAAGGGGGGGAAKKPRGMYGEVRLSEALAAVTGKAQMTRSDLTKWFWAYVKGNELQVRVDCVCVVWGWGVGVGGG